MEQRDRSHEGVARSGPSGGTSPGPRWFISAPVEVDLGPLIARLRERGARPYVLSDVALPGADLLHSVQDAISAADRVLVVLDAAATSLNSVFEAGIAVGHGKPIVILTDPRIPAPSDFANLLTIRARPDDLDAIDFTLDQMEKAERRLLTDTRPALATDRALGSHAAELLDQLAHASPLTEQAALGVLTEALETSGAVPAQSPADLGIDLGVWSDDLDAIGANPLFIEVKRSVNRQGVEQVSARLANSPRIHLMLIVYLDEAITSSEALRVVPYPILAISLQELLSRMQRSSFAEVVRELRNASVHKQPSP